MIDRRVRIVAALVLALAFGLPGCSPATEESVNESVSETLEPPDVASVPYVAGLSVAVARKVLVREGFIVTVSDPVEFEEFDGCIESFRALGTDPEVGTELDSGSHVAISFEPSVEETNWAGERHAEVIRWPEVGATACFECHYETGCSFCHVQTISSPDATQSP